MNSDEPRMAPDDEPAGASDRESRITAKLLGELTPTEALELERSLAEKPEFARLESRLRATLDLVREVAREPVEPTKSGTKLPTFSPGRREEILAKLRERNPTVGSDPARVIPVEFPEARSEAAGSNAATNGGTGRLAAFFRSSLAIAAALVGMLLVGAWLVGSLDGLSKRDLRVYSVLAEVGSESVPSSALELDAKADFARVTGGDGVRPVPASTIGNGLGVVERAGEVAGLADSSREDAAAPRDWYYRASENLAQNATVVSGPAHQPVPPSRPPSPASSEPSTFTVDPRLMSRYGLMPSAPAKPTAGGPVPTAAPLTPLALSSANSAFRTMDRATPVPAEAVPAAPEASVAAGAEPRFMRVDALGDREEKSDELARSLGRRMESERETLGKRLESPRSSGGGGGGFGGGAVSGLAQPSHALPFFGEALSPSLPRLGGRLEEPRAQVAQEAVRFDVPLARGAISQDGRLSVRADSLASESLAAAASGAAATGPASASERVRRLAVNLGSSESKSAIRSLAKTSRPLSETSDLARDKAPVSGDELVLGERMLRQESLGETLSFQESEDRRRARGLVSRTSSVAAVDAEAEAENGSIVKENRSESAPRAGTTSALGIPEAQPETPTSENNVSTFSLNVSDVSFKLADASLQNGQLPAPGAVRTEEFVNAFRYRDPEPAPGSPLAFTFERAQFPFAQAREVMRIAVRTVATGREGGRPLNLVLLLDASGSMERSDRIATVKKALEVMGEQLKPEDKLSVVAFARSARLWVDGMPGNQARELVERVGSLTAEGGTHLEGALVAGYEIALRHFIPDGVNRVVLLTDGAANLGELRSDALRGIVENHRRRGIALDCFGIGFDGYNDELLEALSRNGDGRYGFVNTPDEAGSGFVDQLAGALNVAASDVKVQVEFNPRRVDSWRQVGYAKHQLEQEQFRDNSVDAAEIGAAESGNALYVMQTNRRGIGPIGTVRARFRDPVANTYSEHEWVVPYEGRTVALEQASPAMRLAVVASAFGEMLSSSPYAAEVTNDRLLSLLDGVPETFKPDPRPEQLTRMVRQAQSIMGK